MPDKNRPDFTGDPKMILAIRNVLLDHITIEGSRNVGIIHGLPNCPITNITFQDINHAHRR